MRMLFVLVFTCLCAAAVLADNLIKNGSFEEREPADPTYPRYWSEKSGDSLPLAFTSDHHAGAAAGMLPSDKKDHLWRQIVMEPGVRAFTISAMVKAEDVALESRDDYALLYGHILYKGLPYSSATHFFLKIPPGTYDWKRLSITGGTNNVAPIEKVLVSITGKISRGSLSFDEVELTENRDLSPEAMLEAKIDDLLHELERVGPIDSSVAISRARLAEARSSHSKDLWVQAVSELAPKVWSTMYPDAMTDRPVEARMIYHGGLGSSAQTCDEAFVTMERARFNGTYHSLGAWMGVIYHSKLLPVEPQWRDFDALKYSIEQARRRGIKSFAYLAALYGTRELPTEGTLFQSHPEWFAKGPDKLMPVFPDPANPEVADFIVQVYTEIATNYDLDGIGLDYIRYPTPTALNYDENNRKQIMDRYGFDICDGRDQSGIPERWAKIEEYRAEKVGAIVRRVRESVRKAKPNMSVIACLISDPDEARQYGQNWAVSSVNLDYATPMNYSDVSGDEKLLARQHEIFARNKVIYIPAIGGMPEVHEQWTLSDWARRIALQRKAGSDGVIVYRMNGFDPAVAAFLGNGPFNHAAAFPSPPQK